tara:strand:+ start:62 stop:1750 length:1689 start_codon:yes stop_codon:yes gene_type:complete
MVESGQSLKQFFTAGTYRIPKFQRDYSWQKDQITEFWNDAWDVWGEKLSESYFFGPVVLINDKKGNPIGIVDGQQRITTVSIFLILIRDILRSSGEEKVATQIEVMIQDWDIGRKSTAPKLQLNQINNPYYLDKIFPYDDPAIKIKLPKELKKTNQRLRETYKILYDRIKAENSLDNHDTLADFCRYILDTFEFNPITVDSKNKAYRIFATLNQRGKNLSDSDLIKNYLLETGGDHNETANHKRWMEISETIKSENLDQFLKHYWIANYGHISKQKLYEEITKNIKTYDNVTDFLLRLYEEHIVYKELLTPTESFWGDERNQNYINDLFEKFKNDSAQPLFLAAHRKWKNDGKSCDFKKLARICMDLHFRCKTIGPQTAANMVKRFAEAAEIIRSPPKDVEPKVKGDLDDVKKILKKLDIPNTQFETYIENESYSGTTAKYILSKITSSSLTTRPMTKVFKDATLEHILPQTMNQDWKKLFTVSEHDRYLERIGNLTLIDGLWNSEMQNASFEEKKIKYALQKDVKITSDLSNESKWDPDAIEKRSKRFAGDVSSIWLSLID